MQTGGSAADSADAATSGAVDTTGATLLVAMCSWFNGGETSGASDSKGNTWTAKSEQIFGSVTVQIYYVNSNTPTVGAGHTFTCGGTGVYPVLSFVAASGTTATPFDQENTGANTGTSAQPGSITPTEDNELIVAVVGTSIGQTHAINGGYSTAFFANGSGGVTMGGGGAYLIQTSATATNPTFSWTTSDNGAAAIASFKAVSGGGGGGGGRHRMLRGVGR